MARKSVAVEDWSPFDRNFSDFLNRLGVLPLDAWIAHATKFAANSDLDFDGLRFKVNEVLLKFQEALIQNRSAPNSTKIKRHADKVRQAAAKLFQLLCGEHVGRDPMNRPVSAYLCGAYFIAKRAERERREMVINGVSHFVESATPQELDAKLLLPALEAFMAIAGPENAIAYRDFWAKNGPRQKAVAGLIPVFETLTGRLAKPLSGSGVSAFLDFALPLLKLHEKTLTRDGLNETLKQVLAQARARKSMQISETR